jgi:hypothetical protein
VDFSILRHGRESLEKPGRDEPNRDRGLNSFNSRTIRAVVIARRASMRLRAADLGCAMTTIMAMPFQDRKPCAFTVRSHRSL